MTESKVNDMQELSEDQLMDVNGGFWTAAGVAISAAILWFIANE